MASRWQARAFLSFKKGPWVRLYSGERKSTYSRIVPRRIRPVHDGTTTRDVLGRLVRRRRRTGLIAQPRTTVQPAVYLEVERRQDEEREQGRGDQTADHPDMHLDAPALDQVRAEQPLAEVPVLAHAAAVQPGGQLGAQLVQADDRGGCRGQRQQIDRHWPAQALQPPDQHDQRHLAAVADQVVDERRAHAPFRVVDAPQVFLHLPGEKADIPPSVFFRQLE